MIVSVFNVIESMYIWYLESQPEFFLGGPGRRWGEGGVGFSPWQKIKYNIM
jgi:hypothetical protein